jgi:thiol-disulfide isomerase/thioredoxin
MNNPLSRLLVIGALALAAIWAGTRFYLASHAGGVTAVPAGSASPPSVSDLSAQSLSTPTPKIPEHLPTFELDNLDGEKTSSIRWQGRPLVLNFWATWCGPCRQEIPLLESLSSEWAKEGVTVVGIAVDYPDKVKEFAQQYKIGYPLLVGEQPALDLAAKLGMETPVFPFTVFADQKGDVVTLYVGELHRSQANLIMELVQQLDQGKIALPAARERIASGLSRLGDNSGQG